MNQRIITFLIAFLGFTGLAFAQAESMKADPSLKKDKPQETKSNSLETSKTEVKVNEESRPSGIVKPEPVIIYRDEEKTGVQPK